MLGFLVEQDMQPGEILCSRWSLQNVALVLCGVRDRGRPHSLGTASLRDGCSGPPLASPAPPGMLAAGEQNAYMSDSQ